MCQVHVYVENSLSVCFLDLKIILIRCTKILILYFSLDVKSIRNQYIVNIDENVLDFNLTGEVSACPILPVLKT